MKRKNHISLLIFLVLELSVLFLPTSVFASNSPDEAQKKQILNKAYRVQVPFVENRGQVESKEVRFYAKTFGGTIFVEQNGALTYHLPARDNKPVVIKEILTQKGTKIEGLEPSPTRVNYFKGKDRNKWRTNIPTYGSISLGEIYKGIELKLKAYGNNAEKLFNVSPKENPEEIRIKVIGSKGLKVTEEGELEVLTELGSIKFTKPIAYQETGGRKDTVEVAYALYEGNVYGFKVGDYDKNRSLTIDPLLASTFIGGGESGDEGNSIALDASGNVYVAGKVYSDTTSDFPTTSGGYDTSYNGSYDVFVSKLDSSLSSLLASTFIGGSDDDIGNSIALDSGGNVYVTGYTSSSNYPTTPGGYDTIHNGPDDVFVSKLDSSLSSLLASTFIGGSDDDIGISIALDSGGNVYVTGYTSSSNYPTTPGGYDTIHNGGDDVFVSKLDSNLSAILYNISLVLPNGGDVIPSGGTYGICWNAPPAVVKFDLYYSTNNGTSWNFIKTVTGLHCTHWEEVPVVTANKNTCRVKVIGYDSNGAKVGEDISDKPFTIEVLRVTSPNGGEILKSGDTSTIQWITHKTIRPVAKTVLKYSTDGTNWIPIKTLTGNPGSFNWKVPAASSSKCKVKVILKDANGANIGTDVSDKVFTIQP